MSVFQGKAPPKSQGNGERWPLLPAANYPACLVAMVDLGTHRESFQGGDPKDVHKVYLCWELTEEPIPGQTGNYLIGRDFTLSFHEKAGLRLMLEAWRGSQYQEGEAVNLGVVLGKKCFLNVKHKTTKGTRNTYAIIDGVTPAPKKTPISDPSRKPFSWEINADADLDDLPDWLPYLYGTPVSGHVESSQEWRDRHVRGDADEAGAAEEAEQPEPEGIAF